MPLVDAVKPDYALKTKGNVKVSSSDDYYHRLLAIPPLKFILLLWSNTFSFRSEGPLRCSLALMIFTFVNSSKHPSFVLVNAAAWQLYGFLLFSFVNVFLSFLHLFIR